MLKFSSHTYILFAIIIGAAAFRIGAALLYGDMWSDEIFHIAYSQVPSWSQTWHYLTLETNPPLFTILMKLWRIITPEHEIWYRLPNVIIGTSTVYAIYIFGKKLFSTQIALYAAAVMALYPYHIFMSATIRGYALLMLLTIISSHYLYNAFLTPHTTKKDYYLYTLFTTLMLYSHIVALGIWITHGIILLIYKKNKLRWIYASCISFAFFSVWIAPWAYNRVVYWVSDGWFLYTVNFKKLTSMFVYLFTGSTHPIHYIAVILAFVVTLLFLCTKLRHGLPYKSNLHFLLWLWGIPLFGALMFSMWHIKFISTIIAFTALLIAYILVALISKPCVRWSIIALIYIPPLIYMYTVWLPMQSWNSVNDFIARETNPKEKQLIINDNISHLYEMKWYYMGTMPYIIYSEPTNLDSDTYYITQNYRYYRRTDAELDEWIRAHDISQYNDIFIIENKKDQILLRDRLLKHGWQVVEEFQTNLIGYAKIAHVKH